MIKQNNRLKTGYAPCFIIDAQHSESTFFLRGPPKKGLAPEQWIR